MINVRMMNVHKEKKNSKEDKQTGRGQPTEQKYLLKNKSIKVAQVDTACTCMQITSENNN